MEPSPCSLVTVQPRGDVTVMYCNGAGEHSGTMAFKRSEEPLRKGDLMSCSLQDEGLSGEERWEG